jgi:sec-independent protein translocase protein TatC
MPDPKYMTFVEHLQELRERLAKSFAAIIVGSIAGWFLAPRVIHLLDQPLSTALGKNVPIYVDTVYGGFTLQLKVAIVVGFVFALPVTVFQMWAFVAPAFGAGANRWAPIWMVSALALFLAGGFTGYAVIPLALKFFAKFQGGDTGVQVIPFATQYLNFFILILLVFGVSFELPLVLVSLSAAGITSSRWLASKRLYFFFGIFIFATVVTPGADLISPLILGAILYVLYETSIVICKLLGK